MKTLKYVTLILSITVNPCWGDSFNSIQSSISQQRILCSKMEIGSREQSLCDLKANCMQDDLNQQKIITGLPADPPSMAPGQCNGANPISNSTASTDGDAQLGGLEQPIPPSQGKSTADKPVPKKGDAKLQPLFDEQPNSSLTGNSAGDSN